MVAFWKKRTSRDYRKSTATGPKRHLATFNWRIAKGLSDHRVGGHLFVRQSE
jgi:hypothetical protein